MYGGSCRATALPCAPLSPLPLAVVLATSNTLLATIIAHPSRSFVSAHARGSAKPQCHTGVCCRRSVSQSVSLSLFLLFRKGSRWRWHRGHTCTPVIVAPHRARPETVPWRVIARCFLALRVKLVWRVWCVWESGAGSTSHGRPRNEYGLSRASTHHPPPALSQQHIRPMMPPSSPPVKKRRHTNPMSSTTRYGFTLYTT